MRQQSTEMFNGVTCDRGKVMLLLCQTLLTFTASSLFRRRCLAELCWLQKCCLSVLAGLNIPAFRSADGSHYSSVHSHWRRAASLYHYHQQLPTATATAAAAVGRRGNAAACRCPHHGRRTSHPRDAGTRRPVAQIHLQDAWWVRVLCASARRTFFTAVQLQTAGGCTESPLYGAQYWPCTIAAALSLVVRT